MTRYQKYARKLRRAASREMLELLKKQDGKCWWCGCPIQRGVNATIDHVHPISEGGGNRANIVAACKPCNSRRNEEHLQNLRRIEAAVAAKAERARRSFKPINRSKVNHSHRGSF